MLNLTIAKLLSSRVNDDVFDKSFQFLENFHFSLSHTPFSKSPPQRNKQRRTASLIASHQRQPSNTFELHRVQTPHPLAKAFMIARPRLPEISQKNNGRPMTWRPTNEIYCIWRRCYIYDGHREATSDTYVIQRTFVSRIQEPPREPPSAFSIPAHALSRFKLKREPRQADVRAPRCSQIRLSTVNNS